MFQELEPRRMFAITTGILGAEPTPATTGPSNPAILVNSGSVTVSGSLSPSAPRIVLKNLNITGELDINASNVLVQNVRVNANGGPFCVKVMAGTVGTVLQHGELYGAAVAGVSGNNCVLQYFNIHNNADGCDVGDTITTSPQTTIQYSLISNNSGNAVSVVPGSTKINLFCDDLVAVPGAAAVQLNGNGSTVSIDGTWLDGGLYTINNAGTNNLTVVNSFFGRDDANGLLLGSAFWSHNEFYDDGSVANP